MTTEKRHEYELRFDTLLEDAAGKCVALLVGARIAGAMVSSSILDNRSEEIAAASRRGVGHHHARSRRRKI